MDPLVELISINLGFAVAASDAFDQGKTDTCYKILFEQLGFLIDSIMISTPEPPKPSETAGG